MEKVNIYKFYKFGKLVYKTKNLPKHITFDELHNQIKWFEKNIEELDLFLYKKLINSKLKSILKKISKIDSRNTTVPIELLEKVKESISEIEEFIKKELCKMHAYVPPFLKIDIDHLTNQQDKLFDSGVLAIKNLPTSVLENIIQFGQCYAFGTFTASSIHIIKATEEYNRFFNSILSKSEIYLDINWQDTIEESKNILIEINNYYTDNTIELIKKLHIIKNDYRHKIIHYNKIILDENEAFDLFTMCSDVVNRMYNILNSNKLKRVIKS